MKTITAGQLRQHPIAMLDDGEAGEVHRAAATAIGGPTFDPVDCP